MKMKHLLLLLPVTTISALILISCGSDGTSCDTPITITPGTWCITLQTTDNNCGTDLTDATPYEADFIQNGTYLSATSNSISYGGTICGNNATMVGTHPTISTDMDIIFSDASNASGSVVWDNGSCSGTDTFVAVAGSCPL